MLAIRTAHWRIVVSVKEYTRLNPANAGSSEPLVQIKQLVTIAMSKTESQSRRKASHREAAQKVNKNRVLVSIASCVRWIKV